MHQFKNAYGPRKFRILSISANEIKEKRSRPKKADVEKPQGSLVIQKRINIIAAVREEILALAHYRREEYTKSGSAWLPISSNRPLDRYWIPVASVRIQTAMQPFFNPDSSFFICTPAAPAAHRQKHVLGKLLHARLQVDRNKPTDRK